MAVWSKKAPHLQNIHRMQMYPHEYSTMYHTHCLDCTALHSITNNLSGALYNNVVSAIKVNADRFSEHLYYRQKIRQIDTYYAAHKRVKERLKLTYASGDV